MYDLGTTFCALSLRAEGYSVWANIEASGTTTEFIRDVSNDRKFDPCQLPDIETDT